MPLLLSQPFSSTKGGKSDCNITCLDFLEQCNSVHYCLFLLAHQTRKSKQVMRLLMSWAFSSVKASKSNFNITCLDFLEQCNSVHYCLYLLEHHTRKSKQEIETIAYAVALLKKVKSSYVTITFVGFC